jgi:hypothetical protein
VLNAFVQCPNHWLWGDKIHIGNRQRQNVCIVMVPFTALCLTAVNDLVEVVSHGASLCDQAVKGRGCARVMLDQASVSIGVFGAEYNGANPLISLKIVNGT